MERQELKALKLSLTGSLVFAVLGLSFAIYTGSQAILLDGIWDVLAFVLGIFALKISSLLAKPASDKMPFGYVAFEPFYILVKGLVAAVLTAFIVINNIIIITQGGNPLELGVVVLYVSIVIVGNLFVYSALRFMSRKINSPVVKVEKESWLVNLLISSGVGLSFLIVYLFGNGILKPVNNYIDQIVAISVGVLTLSIPLKQIITGLKELLLVAPEISDSKNFNEKINQVIDKKQVFNFKTSILKTGRKYWLTLFIKPQKNQISIGYVDKLKKELEDKLSSELSYVNVDIIPTNDVLKN